MRTIFFFALLVSCHFLHSQSSVIQHISEISFGQNHTCRNVRMDHRIRLKRSVLRLGMMVILKGEPRDAVYFYRNRAFPQKFGEYFELQMGYNYEFLRTKNEFNLYSFVDFQISKPSVLMKYYYPIGNPTALPNNLTSLPTQFVKVAMPPQLMLESNLGIGCTLPISNRIFLNQMVGFGLFLTKRPFMVNNSWIDYDPIFPFVRIGLCWKWKEGEPKK